MKNFIVILAFLCASLALPAQNNALLRSVAFLTGAEDVESLDQQEIDRYFYYAAHPLRINSASLSRLVSSGLFSQYQAACLLDYRQRQGDVLSAAELALVDGFGEETARALALFLSFESERLPGAPAGPARPSQNLKVKGSVREKEGLQYGDGAQYLFAGESLEVNLAGRSTYLESFRPTGSVAWQGRPYPFRAGTGVVDRVFCFRPFRCLFLLQTAVGTVSIAVVFGIGNLAGICGRLYLEAVAHHGFCGKKHFRRKHHLVRQERAGGADSLLQRRCPQGIC